MDDIENEFDSGLNIRSVSIDELHRRADKMLKVYLKVPVHRSIEAWHADSLLRLQEYEKKRGEVDLQINFLVGESLISRARNTIAYDFLNSDADYLFMLDSDIIFEPNILETLLSHKKKLIGGNYLHKCDEIKRAGICEDPFADLSLASYIPTGCILIHRSIFEELDKKLANLPEDDPYKIRYYETSVQAHVPGYFIPFVDEQSIYLSEDWAFSRRCLKAEIQGWMDNTIRLGHIGTKVYAELI